MIHCDHCYVIGSMHIGCAAGSKSYGNAQCVYIDMYYMIPLGLSVHCDFDMH